MSDYIPQELLIEILTRLPVKSLVRFTLVCRSWHNIITGPNFITAHLNLTKKTRNNNNPELLLRYFDTRDRRERYALLRDDETLGAESSELEFPLVISIGYFRIVGSCNGLLCVSDDLFGDMRTIVLWNPSIRRSITLPRPSKPKLPHMFVLGFGVDPSTRDFKVVRIVYYKESLHVYNLPPQVDVFSLNTGSWKTVVAAAPPYCMVEFIWSGAFLNRSVHWIAYEHNPLFVPSLIVSFDMGDEVFGEIRLPEVLAGDLATNLFVTVIGESLAVLNYGKQMNSTSCGVWVMKEYGVAQTWTRLFNVDLGGTLEKVVGFRNNGEILVSPGSNKLLCYNPKTGTIKDLSISGNTRSLYIDQYVETLFLFDGHDRNFDGVLQE